MSVSQCFGSTRTPVELTSRICRVLSAAGVGLAASAVLATTGCGNNYRPVVTSINPVGPAGQPTKYAVAISNPGTTSPGLVTVVDFSGDTVLVTPNIGVNPLYLAMGSGGSEGYTINGDGTLNSFGISTSLQTRNVLQTTLLPNSTPPVSLFPEGSYTYVSQPARNSIAELSGSPPALQQEISTGAGGPVYVVGIAGATRVYALNQGTPTGGVYPAGTATAIDVATNTKTNTIATGREPVYGVMTASGQRAFIMNKEDGTVTVINAQTNQLDLFPTGGTVTGFSIAGNVVTVTVPNTLAVGQSITLNGLSVGTYLNGVALTVTSASATQFTAAFTHANVASTVDSGSVLTSTINVGVAPVWADFAPTLTELLVLNQGNGTSAGSVSVISIPLCASNTTVTDPNCDVNNPTDAVGFGTTVATIPVGVNPSVIGVLQDGSQAFTANQGPAGGQGSVSAINLLTDTVVATLPASNASTVSPTDTLIHGNPSFLAVTTGTPTGKVYVTSANSNDLTLIETDTDQVFTHISLQGLGVMVRTTQP